MMSSNIQGMYVLIGLHQNEGLSFMAKLYFKELRSYSQKSPSTRQIEVGDFFKKENR